MSWARLWAAARNCIHANWWATRVATRGGLLHQRRPLRLQQRQIGTRCLFASVVAGRIWRFSCYILVYFINKEISYNNNPTLSFCSRVCLYIRIHFVDQVVTCTLAKEKLDMHCDGDVLLVWNAKATMPISRSHKRNDAYFFYMLLRSSPAM